MILTNLIFEDFFTGATSSTVVPPPPVANPPGGSGRRYNTQSLDLDYWSKKRKRLEAKVKAVEKKIQAKRRQLDHTLDISTLNSIKKQMLELQKALLELLADLDMARKEIDQAEEEAAVAAYIALRYFH